MGVAWSLVGSTGIFLKSLMARGVRRTALLEVGGSVCGDVGLGQRDRRRKGSSMARFKGVLERRRIRGFCSRGQEQRLVEVVEDFSQGGAGDQEGGEM